MKRRISLVISSLLLLSIVSGCSIEKNEDPSKEAPVVENTGDKGKSDIKISTGEDAPEYSETLTTDVLVLGGGGAGITGALTASEN